MIGKNALLLDWFALLLQHHFELQFPWHYPADNVNVARRDSR